MTVVVKTENLGKKYIISHERPERYTALRDVMANKAKLFIKKTKSIFSDEFHPTGETEEFWALRDINMEIYQGDSYGIVGKNGAGKSTLLKVLSRITEPSEGWVGIKGRVASLLEVGTGFHPELTGNENIFLNGAILGMTRSEIRSKFDEIVDFSGVEKFLDTPVKKYSSGMRVRLAFSVAAHLEPEILVIDEVLAVGDAEFQRKCLGKMKDVAGQGRTVLFVSHNMVAVQSLCNKGLLLEKGRIVSTGAATDIVQQYMSKVSQQGSEIRWNEAAKAPGNDMLKLVSASVVPTIDQEGSGLITMASAFEIGIRFTNITLADNDFNIGVHVLNDQDVVAFAGSLVEGYSISDLVPGTDYKVSCIVPGQLLNAGNYRVNILVFRNSTLLFRADDALGFVVTEQSRKDAWFGRKAGIFRPQLDWKISQS